MPANFSRRHFLWLGPSALLLIAGAGLAKHMIGPLPSGLDLALSKTSSRGLYVVSLAADRSPVPVGAIHTWTVKVTTPVGQPVAPVEIAIDGGMPQHGHGLPTKPVVTRELGAGQYAIDGMKFNMAGWWTLTVSVDGPSGADKATFNLVL